MKVVAKVVVLGLAVLTAFGAAGCNRGGGAPATVIQSTIIQQTGGGNSAHSSSSSSTIAASIAPIDDPKELCHQVFAKTRGLNNAVNAFWKIATTVPGWAYADPATGDAVSRVDKEYGQVFPALDKIVGKGLPGDTTDAANDYLKTLKEISNAIIEQRKNEVLNPAASKYADAKDRLSSICAGTE